jgi:hypothetical protein
MMLARELLNLAQQQRRNRMNTTKRLFLAMFCVALVGAANANTLKDKPPTIFYPEGHYLEGWPRQLGFDMFGYNYQAHKFAGYFANVYLGGDGLPPYGGNTAKYYDAVVMYGYFDTVEEAEAALSAEWFWPLRDVNLRMSWNDAWLSNQDRGDDAMGTIPDGNLDRHFGFPSYFDSGAELVQYQVEPIQVMDSKGRVRTINAYYYSKIIAVPSTAVKVDGIWYTEDGVELGPEIYGSFAKVATFYHNPLEDGKPLGPAWGMHLRDLVCPDGSKSGKVE